MVRLVRGVGSAYGDFLEADSGQLNLNYKREQSLRVTRKRWTHSAEALTGDSKEILGAPMRPGGHYFNFR